MTDPAVRTLAVATDTELADLWRRRAGVESTIASAIDTVRRIAGQHRNVRQEWSGTWDEAAACEIMSSWDAKRRDEALARLEAARSEIATIDARVAELDTVWLANGRWSRFFLVLNSNGHIHSSMACHTCFASTLFSWLPHLSGLDEADAVVDQGEILCSVCFPTAPVEWTVGESRATVEARQQREAAKAERQARKLAKALLPDGSALVVACREGDRWPERLETLHAANAFLTDAAEWGGYLPDSVARVAEAVAAKTGATIDEVMAAAAKRAAARARR